MAYTLGARHVLVGTGQVAISSPIGLRIAITGIPAWASRSAGTPLEYFQLGQLVPGNPDGWLPEIPLHHSAQLAYPLPDSLTVLGYDLVAGATATVDELVGVTVPGALAMPWDRSPTRVLREIFADLHGGTPLTQYWSYVVPAGRKAMLSRASTDIQTSIAGTVDGWAEAGLYLNSLEICMSNLYARIAGAQDKSSVDGGPLILLPGDTLTFSAKNLQVDGYIRVHAVILGIEFTI